jgi:hypothetical protein
MFRAQQNAFDDVVGKLARSLESLIAPLNQLLTSASHSEGH